MLRHLLTFAALTAAHAVASFATLWCCAFTTGGGEFLCGFMFLPTVLLLHFSEDSDHLPDLGSLVGLGENSPLAPVLHLTVNSLLWVGSAYGLWLAGRWVRRKI
jgi:hypothetical protein